ncbi:hypothetical protein NDU88_002319 [Pleurodeles waltl]|uniref:Uncharacterized protein n=1 Tax=Pleurodeles waltl TaxID=8319 RepID=A0AAV7WP47_PLEWA|nr:hypothetical protein NDU88_002319 [Pleurodeles waltl]
MRAGTLKRPERMLKTLFPSDKRSPAGAWQIRRAKVRSWEGGERVLCLLYQMAHRAELAALITASFRKHCLHGHWLEGATTLRIQLFVFVPSIR